MALTPDPDQLDELTAHLRAALTIATEQNLNLLAYLIECAREEAELQSRQQAGPDDLPPS